MKIRVIGKRHDMNGNSCAAGSKEPLTADIANQYSITVRIQTSVHTRGECMRMDVSKEEFERRSLDEIIFEG